MSESPRIPTKNELQASLAPFRIEEGEPVRPEQCLPRWGPYAWSGEGEGSAAPGEHHEGCGFFAHCAVCAYLSPKGQSYESAAQELWSCLRWLDAVVRWRESEDAPTEQKAAPGKQWHDALGDLGSATAGLLVRGHQRRLGRAVELASEFQYTTGTGRLTHRDLELGLCHGQFSCSASGNDMLR